MVPEPASGLAPDRVREERRVSRARCEDEGDSRDAGVCREEERSGDVDDRAPEPGDDG